MMKTTFLILLLACGGCGTKKTENPGRFEQVPFGAKSYQVAYPNPILTPGDVVPGATRDIVCAEGYSKRMRRELSKEDKANIYKSYDLAYDSTKYQIDHFIPLSIGGSNDPRNLWPQPIVNNAGFLEKQQVADFLHRRVCDGTIDIHTAQELVRKDWHSVYLSMKKRKARK